MGQIVYCDLGLLRPEIRRVGDADFRFYSARKIWRQLNREAVEFATLEWVDWFNSRRIIEPIGNIPPAVFEELYYQSQVVPAMVAGLTLRRLWKT